jgi:hypothetical protein
MLRSAVSRSSRVVHVLSVVVACVGEWIYEREPSRVIR